MVLSAEACSRSREVVSRCGLGGTEVAVAVEFDSREAVHAAPCRIAVHARTGGGSRVADAISALAPEIVLSAEVCSRSREVVCRCGLCGAGVAVAVEIDSREASQAGNRRIAVHGSTDRGSRAAVEQSARARAGPVCGGLQSESRGGESLWTWRHRSSGGCRD
jgi:ribosomal protein S7